MLLCQLLWRFLKDGNYLSQIFWEISISWHHLSACLVRENLPNPPPPNAPAVWMTNLITGLAHSPWLPIIFQFLPTRKSTLIRRGFESLLPLRWLLLLMRNPIHHIKFWKEEEVDFLAHAWPFFIRLFPRKSYRFFTSPKLRLSFLALK